MENTAYYLNYITVRMEYLKRLPNPPNPCTNPKPLSEQPKVPTKPTVRL